MRYLHNVLIFDIHGRDKIYPLIEQYHSVKSVQVVSSVEEATMQLEQSHFSLALFIEDSVTDHVSQILNLIARNNYDASTMLLMEDCTSTELVRAAKMGVSGFSLLKERPITLLQGVQQMFINGSYIHPNIAPTLLKGMTNIQALQDVSVNLTKREIDILICIAKGCSGTEISEMLHISNHTVSSHIKNIYRKLDIHSKGEAVVEAIRMGLVDVDGTKTG